MNKEATLRRVLESYAAETPDGNNTEVLKKWMARFPDYASELMAFASERAHMEHLPDEEIEGDEMEAFLVHGRERFRQLLDASKKAPVPISSLAALVEERGMKKREFARTVGLSLSLFVQLDKRNVLAPTVPSKVIESLAAKLEVAAESVRAYLELPQVAAEGNFKAEVRPEPLPQVDFGEAVRKDRDLSDVEKRYLLE
ncbi:MAG: hypothetical protein IPM63_12925 [Acidobacteriota bacterium]|nr:MAG: hypothetical protein IPM63_12925 [Acidobacteriota bacterium]